MGFALRRLDCAKALQVDLSSVQVGCFVCRTSLECQAHIPRHAQTSTEHPVPQRL